MDLILTFLLPYLISLAANERSGSITKNREKALAAALAREDELKAAIASRRSLRDELAIVCANLARQRDAYGLSQGEGPLWEELTNVDFQTALAEWLMAGGIAEGAHAKQNLIDQMAEVLVRAGATPQQIAHLQASYLDEIEKAILSHPILVHWRHQLSLDYLREQVTALREFAEENAGLYSAQRIESCLERYSQCALAEWDIIDLSNLPEGDVQIATQKLLLRQLYMPLRVEVESGSDREDILTFEDDRSERRMWPGGIREAKTVEERGRTPIGHILGSAQRVVVLGDPGGGKTTMLRWLATSYLLRQRRDPALTHVPDVETLPDNEWLPVLIRCRDLGDADLCRSFSDFLSEHFRKTPLLPEEAKVLLAVVLERFATGRALLLVDGLDEITNPRVRAMFSQELERTAARYPAAHIVVTSRIVGYRDMPFRMGDSFIHGVIAELHKEDKDNFASRWVNLTEQHQPSSERERRVKELIQALHSSDRIERLTDNPMLLTTLALVKRKVGKLPNRRNKLYAEAVSVLLNWNPRLYSTIEEDEALPQLEYLAYEMCQRGIQRLAGDEVLDLLDRLRVEYPNIRAIKKRDPEAFLTLLEERSSILIRSGGLWEKGATHEKPVWEFRHLTFQEYLAAKALLDGRYPGRNRALSLADQVAPLAVAMSDERPSEPFQIDHESVEDGPVAVVPESWREAIRLLVAECKDDDVDDVLMAVLTPLPSEDASKTARPRANLAALCLSDEPNVSEQCARNVLTALSRCVNSSDGHGGGAESTLDEAAQSLEPSPWLPLLKECLLAEFGTREADDRWNVGGVWSSVGLRHAEKLGLTEHTFGQLVLDLKRDAIEATSAALVLMSAAFEGKLIVTPGLTEGLLQLLERRLGMTSHAAAWAMGWMVGRDDGQYCYWKPHGAEVARLIHELAALPASDLDTRRWILITIGGAGEEKAADTALISELNSPHPTIRRAAADSIKRRRTVTALSDLLPLLNDPSTPVAKAAVEAVRAIDGREAIDALVDVVGQGREEVSDAALVTLRLFRDVRALPGLLRVLPRAKGDRALRLAVLCAYLRPTVQQNPLWTGTFAGTASQRRRISAVISSYYGATPYRRILQSGVRREGSWIDLYEIDDDAHKAAAAASLNVASAEVDRLVDEIIEDFKIPDVQVRQRAIGTEIARRQQVLARR